MPDGLGGANPATMQAALEQTWTDREIGEQLYQENPVWDRIKRVNSTKTGEYARTPIHVERNWGFSVTPPEGGNLNDPGQQGYRQARWWYRHEHTQVKVQGSAIDQTAGDTLALAKVVDEETKGAVNDLDRQLTRQVFSDGTAYLFAVSAITGSSITPDSFGQQAIERGWIDTGLIFTTDGTNRCQVVSADAAAPTITFTLLSGTAPAPAAMAYTPGSRAAGQSLEMNGLRNIVHESLPVGDIDPANVAQWKSPVDRTTTALTLMAMYDRNRVVAQKTGKAATWVVTSLKQQQYAYALASAQVRYSNEHSLPIGDVDAVTLNGVKLYAVPDCLDSDMFFLNLEDFRLLTAGDPYWQNKITGGNPLVWVQGSDAYMGKITTRVQLGTRRRNNQSAMYSLAGFAPPVYNIYDTTPGP